MSIDAFKPMSVYDTYVGSVANYACEVWGFHKAIDGRALIEVNQHQSRANEAIRRHLVERVIPLSGNFFLYILFSLSLVWKL